jgi:hypothetical protein
MKNIIALTLFSVLILMLVKCDINMDNQYALIKCPNGILDGSQLCNRYGSCEPASRYNGCVQRGLGNCSPCDPYKDTVAVVKSNNNEYASIYQEDIEILPLYSSNMDSLDSLTINALIGNNRALTYYTGSCNSETFSSGYLNRYYYISASGNNSVSQSGSRIIKPTGDENINLSSGTLSFWINLRTISSVNNMKSQASCRVFNIDQSVIQIYFVSHDASDVICYLYINNEEVASTKVANNNTWFHVYIVWGDVIQNNKKMRIFINKEEAIAYSGLLPDMSDFNFITSIDGYVLARGSRKCKKVLGVWKECKNITGGTNSSVNIDKLKLWDNVVSEDPEAEYNNL